MFVSKYLVNRQRITDAGKIQPALDKYFPDAKGKSSKCFFRLEWYRIGISIPMIAYSNEYPKQELRPECQLIEVEELQPISAKTQELNFKVFIAPSKSLEKCEDWEDEDIVKFLGKKLEGCAEIISSEVGPNNRLYFKSSPEDVNMTQLQVYNIKGKIKVLDVKKLDKLRSKPLGYHPELGLGLLLLEE